MSLALRWRVPERRIVTQWRGPAGMIAALDRDPLGAIAAVIGPPGSGSSPLRRDASLAATWTLSHSLGRIPAVQVFLASGEAVLTDVAADSAQVTVTFASPQQGFVLLS
jgi:hypothetical protein